MKVLVVGGAGYIGSHMVKHLQENNHEVNVIDNFATGNNWALKDCEIFEVDICDEASINKFLKGKKFDGIIHFAALSIVSESMIKPEEYYRNNVSGSINLFNAMLKNGMNNLIFSSTASVYGIPKSKFISETHSTEPINTYGRTKLIVESILRDYFYRKKLSSVSLRYFNAAGAHISSTIGEERKNETHLIPNIIYSIIDESKKFKLFGNDYDTPDGTCIRDYIHVSDLASAHLKALEKIKNKPFCDVYNLGNGKGFSVLEIIDAIESVSGKKLQFEVHERRDGDPDHLVADSSKAIKELLWKPKYHDIKSIVKTAWDWHISRI